MAALPRPCDDACSKDSESNPLKTIVYTVMDMCTHSSGLHPSTPRCISVGSEKKVSVTATLLHKLLQSIACCLRTLVLGKHDCFLYCLLQCSSHYSQERARFFYNLVPQHPGFQVSSFLGSPYCFVKLCTCGQSNCKLWPKNFLRGAGDQSIYPGLCITGRSNSAVVLSPMCRIVTIMIKGIARTQCAKTLT